MVLTSILYNRNNHEVRVYDRVASIVDGININHRNPSLGLTDYILPSNVSASKCVKEVTNNADIIFLALPTQQVSINTRVFNSYLQICV